MSSTFGTSSIEFARSVDEQFSWLKTDLRLSKSDGYDRPGLKSIRYLYPNNAVAAEIALEWPDRIVVAAVAPPSARLRSPAKLISLIELARAGGMPMEELLELGGVGSSHGIAKAVQEVARVFHRVAGPVLRGDETLYWAASRERARLTGEGRRAKGTDSG